MTKVGAWFGTCFTGGWIAGDFCILALMIDDIVHRCESLVGRSCRLIVKVVTPLGTHNELQTPSASFELGKEVNGIYFGLFEPEARKCQNTVRVVP